MDERSVRRGYPTWAWILGALFLFPLVPMLIGATIPSARRYFGAPGIIVSTVALIVVIGIIGALSGDSNYSSPQSTNQRPLSTPTPALSKDEQCLRDKGCAADRTDWMSEAEVYCGRRIENLARYSYEWTDGWLEPKFDRLIVAFDHSSILYQGSKVRFQNGFGAWQRMQYNCRYDPINDRVLDVEAHPYN